MEGKFATIMERIENAEKWRDSNYADLWRDCFRRYCSEPLPRKEGSNIFVPYTFMQCEVIKARLRESIFAERPYIAALPVEAGDTERAANMQLLLDWQMNEQMEFGSLIGESVAANLIIYGTAITYTGWQLKTRKMVEAAVMEKPLLDAKGLPLFDDSGQPLTMESIAPEAKNVVVYDDPIVVSIPLNDFFVDEEATNIDDARFCGHREYQTKEALEELVMQGKYRIDWQALSEQDNADAYFSDEDAKSLYEVHHYWQDDCHMVLLNREQLICDEANPFWHGMKPYDKCCYSSLPDAFYGIGIPEVLAGLQDELNTTRNQRIDYNSMSLRRMWKMRRGCGLTAHDLVWRQNGVLQVENMDDVMEINIQPMPANAFADEASIKQDMQNTTGCHDILMGLSYTNETATTTLARDSNASMRFRAIISLIIRDLLVPIARKCASMNQQFLTNKRLIRLVGEDNTPSNDLQGISPYDLIGNFDIIFCGSSMDAAANKQLNKEKALQAYSLALADPAYQADDQARMRLFKRVLEALDIKNATSLLPQNVFAAANGEDSALDQMGEPEQAQLLAMAAATQTGIDGESL